MGWFFILLRASCKDRCLSEGSYSAKFGTGDAVVTSRVADAPEPDVPGSYGEKFSTRTLKSRHSVGSGRHSEG
ncbi:hypothetical protein TNCV_1469371 [Trichonephila clavipes]|nr:hypothetical protein TNCV_1469371 [Trichonephila clavipes]